VLPFVKKVECEIVNDPKLNYDYLPILGTDNFFNVATQLLLGDDSVHIKNKNAFGLQALSGTGGLRSGAEFLARIMGYTTFYYSDPSWENHPNIFTAAGFAEERTYRYFNRETFGLDFTGMIEDLQNAPEKSVIILQVCGHNPTAVDPSKEQWRKIADVIEQKKLFPFFDAAYHGFGTGDPDEDVYPVKYFADRGIEFFCSQSFSKNFGIYNIRCGALTVFTNDPSKTAAILSQMMLRVYFIYESPPACGPRIVTRILEDPDLKQQWLDALIFMTTRIADMRQKFQDALIRLKTPGKWDYITKHRGMFAFTALTPDQTKILMDQFHIYILRCGRINICGLSDDNLDYVTRSIHEVVSMTTPKQNGSIEHEKIIQY
jgi:aspartate aminotransferase